MRWWVRVLPVVCSAVVCAAAFTLSFVALSEKAAQTGAVPAHLAWLVPLCVDGAVLAASASLWAASLRGLRKDPVAALTAVVLLVVSVVVNISHAGDSTLAKVIAALPPLTLLACLEIVANSYRAEVRAAQAREDAAAAAADQARRDEAERERRDQAERERRDQAERERRDQAQQAASDQAQQAASGQAQQAVPAWDTAPVPGPDESPATPIRVATDPTSQSRPQGAPDPDRGTIAERPPADPAPVLETVAPAAGSAPARPRPAQPSRAAGPRPPQPESAADAVAALFRAHLESGGASTDPTLARSFAEQLGVTPKTVRKHLGALRVGADTPTDLPG